MTKPRLAAGVGVVSAFLLIGGSGATVAFADPGGSRGSDRDSSSERGDSSHDSRGNSRHGDGGRDDDNGRAAPGSQRRSSDGPQIASRQGSAAADARGSGGGPPTRVGSGRGDTARLSPGGFDDGGSDSNGGSDSDATSAFQPPQVTFGNGRSPGIQRNDPRPRWQAPAPSPAEAPPPSPPAPTPPAPVPSWGNLIATPPAVVVKQFVVAPAAELSDPMWGIAGLLLIPAAGAALGYRQALAAQSAERRNRFSSRP